MKNEVPMTQYEQEISLAELLAVVWKGKKILLIGCVLGVLLGLLAALVIKPKFQASVKFSPALESEISAFNIKGLGNKGPNDELPFPEHTKEDIFNFVNNTIDSPTIMQTFSENNPEMLQHAFDADTEDNLLNLFEKECSLNKGEKQGDVSTYSCEGRDAEALTELVNSYIRYSNQKLMEKMVTDGKSLIALQVKNLKAQIEAKKRLADKTRQDRIAKIEEALSIAKALGIKKPANLESGKGTNENILTVTTRETPLYLRGSVALDAERNNLLARKNNEPFIDGLRRLQEEELFLESKTIDFSEAKLVNISWATVPFKPSGPGKLVFLAAGLILGGFMAICTIFLLQLTKQADFKDAISK